MLTAMSCASCRTPVPTEITAARRWRAACRVPWAIYRCREQKRRRIRGLYQSPVRRRISRIRHESDDVRDRVGHRRTRADAGHRSDRDAPEEHGSGRTMKSRPRLRRDRGPNDRKLRPRPMRRRGRSALASGRDCPNPRATIGSKAAALRSRCWIAYRPPNNVRDRRWRCSRTALSLHGRLGRNRQRLDYGPTASRRTILGCCDVASKFLNADTDKTPYDSGTFASVGMMVPAKAVENAALALREYDLVLARLLGKAGALQPRRRRRRQRRRRRPCKNCTPGCSERCRVRLVSQSVRVAADRCILRLRGEAGGAPGHR